MTGSVSEEKVDLLRVVAQLVEENKQLHAALSGMEARLHALETRELKEPLSGGAGAAGGGVAGGAGGGGSQEQQVLDFLGEETKPALEIAKHVLGAKATKAQINPVLYELQKKNKIRRVGDTSKGNPLWKKI